MSDTTFEEACRCPKCFKPMKTISVRKHPNGSKVHILECETKSCRWFETRKLVEVDKDGNIPTRKPDDREFPKLPQDRKQAERLAAQIQAQLRAETKPGGLELPGSGR